MEIYWETSCFIAFSMQTENVSSFNGNNIFEKKRRDICWKIGEREDIYIYIWDAFYCHL